MPKNPPDELNLAASTIPDIVWALDTPTRLRLLQPEMPHSSFTALWNCPVCETPVPRRRRSGRDRV